MYKAWAKTMKKMCRNARSNAETFSRCLCGFEKFKNNLHSTTRLFLAVDLAQCKNYIYMWNCSSEPNTGSAHLTQPLSLCCLTLYRRRSDYVTMAYWDVAVIFRFIFRFSTVPSLSRPEREVRKLPRSKQCEIHQAQLNVIITKQMFAGDEKIR